MNDLHTIKTFEELMGEISWSWDENYKLTRYEDGNFVLNKLSITPTHVSYKCDAWHLAPGVFEKVIKFYELLNEA